MKNGKKEIKFISLIIYLHNVADVLGKFLDQVVPVFEQNFDQYEIVCVDDACTDASVAVLKEYVEQKQLKRIVSVVHMSFFHGLESAMNAGRDIAIGDFVYEFDHIYVDYPVELILELYQKVLAGNDIVSASCSGGEKWSSRLFYAVYNKTSRGVGKIGPETFRIVSRRAINRVKSMGQYIPYRKAVYANCGLNADTVYYTGNGERHKRRSLIAAGERATLALDSFIYFTNAMERVSAVISGGFLFITVIMGVNILIDLLNHTETVEGWLSTVGFMALGFFGVFALLTIILKYLSVLLNLIFKQQRYLVADIEKVVNE